MKKTTAIASFLFLATLTGIVQAAPEIATKAYVDSKTVQAGHDISVTDGGTVNATYESLRFAVFSQNTPLPIYGISQTDGLIDVTVGMSWGQVAQGVTAPASGGDVYNAIQNAVAGLQPTITGIGDIVVNNNEVSVTYDSLDYDSTSDTEVTGLADGSKRIKTVLQTNGKVGVTVTDWGQVAQGEVAPASGGDVYDAIQEAIQNLGYTAGAGISITDGVIAAKGDPNKNIKVYANEGIGIAMASYDAETDDDNDPGLFDGTMRITSIKQNNTGNIKVGVNKWNEQWTVDGAPIRTQRIKYELNRKTNDVVAGRLISVVKTDTTGVLTNGNLGEKNYTINSTLYPGTGIMFTTENCRGEGTCIALRTSSTSALSFNEDGELSLSGLRYDSTETEAAQGLANGTSRIASITQTDGIISVTTGDWVTSLDEENLTDEDMGVPATAKAIVAAIDQSVDPVEATANNALRVANEAAEDAAEALQAANNAIPKPDPNVCGAPGKRCVLTYGLNGNEMTYEWEVVTRAVE